MLTRSVCGGVAVDVGLTDDLFVQAHYLIREQRLRGAANDDGCGHAAQAV